MNILFLGAPGSGKGTQSKNVEKKFNIPQISTGDLLRAETASESKMGQELKNIMSSGKFVSDEIVLKLVSKKITSDDCKNFKIIDMGQFDREYDPIRISFDERISRKHERIMSMTPEIEDYVVSAVNGDPIEE